jgi:hypothetical protein
MRKGDKIAADDDDVVRNSVSKDLATVTMCTEEIIPQNSVIQYNAYG